MINLIWIETVEDLQEYTGLDCQQLAMVGFCLEKLESVVVSDKKFHTIDEDGYVDWIYGEEGDLLAGILANELWDANPKYIGYNGRHFYMSYHS